MKTNLIPYGILINGIVIPSFSFTEKKRKKNGIICKRIFNSQTGKMIFFYRRNYRKIYIKQLNQLKNLRRMEVKQNKAK